MSFAEILGHERPVALLQRAIAVGRVPHALLFYGPEGVGKGTVARAFAGTLLCESGSGDACGRCGPCRRVRGGTHPDLMVLRRQPSELRQGASLADAKEEEGTGKVSAEIRVFQIRELAVHVAHAPREGRWRVVLIEPADRMNAEAQNALLKTLEEPPGRMVIVLVTSRPYRLLPTVRSRCLAVGFAPLPVAALARALRGRGMPAPEAESRAALAQGCPGRALELDLEALAEQRARILEAWSSLSANPEQLALLPRWVRAFPSGHEDDLWAGLELLESLARDVLRLAVEGTQAEIMHRDARPALEALAQRTPPGRAAELVRSLERLRDDLRFHLNRNVVLQALLAALAGGPLP